MTPPADKFARLSALKPARATPASSRFAHPCDSDAFAQLAGAAVVRNHFGEHLSIRNWFSSPESFDPSLVALDLLASRRDAPLAHNARAALQDPTQWLFLDTETTGLAGGTGTYAFLVGLAWWDAGGLQVDQLFMRDFGEEHSLLHELAERLSERPVLVTFNGKTFDWPLLESRYVMTRSIRTPKLAAHLDLLHPARTLWKLRLGSVRLVELERHVLDAARLGWHRHDDVASALIPQLYFDYLRCGPAEPLLAVIRHNQMDLRGLAALSQKIDALLSGRDAASPPPPSLDLFGLSRFLHRRGDLPRAHSACEQALDLGLPAEFRPRAHRDLALMAGRRGEHDRAASLWMELLSDPQDAVFACEQLSIHFERRSRDIARAIEFAQLGLAKVSRVRLIARDPLQAARASRWEAKFLRRVTRLRKRTGAPFVMPERAPSAGPLIEK